VPGPKYDPEQAKRLVNEAKAEGWDGTIRVLFQNTPAGQKGGLAVEAMLRSVGMNVQLDISKDSTGQQAVVTTSRDFEVTTWGAGGLGPDDTALWALSQNLLSTSPSNRMGFKSDAVDRALADLRIATNDDQRRAAFRTIAEEVNRQVPWVFRVAVETNRTFSPKVHGVVASHRGYVYFDNAWMEL
jgi:peptide/nickel transport system substrate-binding protein